MNIAEKVYNRRIIESKMKHLNCDVGDLLTHHRMNRSLTLQARRMFHEENGKWFK